MTKKTLKEKMTTKQEIYRTQQLLKKLPENIEEKEKDIKNYKKAVKGGLIPLAYLGVSSLFGECVPQYEPQTIIEGINFYVGVISSIYMTYALGLLSQEKFYLKIDEDELKEIKSNLEGIIK